MYNLPADAFFMTVFDCSCGHCFGGLPGRVLALVARDNAGLALADNFCRVIIATACIVPLDDTCLVLQYHIEAEILFLL